MGRIVLFFMLFLLPAFTQAETILDLEEAGLQLRLAQQNEQIWLDVSRSDRGRWLGGLSVIRVFSPNRLVVDVPYAAQGAPRELNLQHPVFSSLRLTPYRNAVRLELGLHSARELRLAQQHLLEGATARLVMELGVPLLAVQEQMRAERLPAELPPPRTEQPQQVKTAANGSQPTTTLSNSKKESWNVAQQYIEQGDGVFTRSGRVQPSLSGPATYDPVDRLTFGYQRRATKRTVATPGSDFTEGIDLRRPSSWSYTQFGFRRIFKKYPATLALVGTMGFIFIVVFGYVMWRVRALKKKERKAKRMRPTGSFADVWHGSKDESKRKKRELAYCYTVLGIDESSSDDDIKTSYKRLIKAFHSDKLESRKLPPEVLELANKQFQKVQSAYETLKQERGFS